MNKSNVIELAGRGAIERPKMGFSVHVADWLRGLLREWGNNYPHDIGHHNNQDILTMIKYIRLFSRICG